MRVYIVNNTSPDKATPLTKQSHAIEIWHSIHSTYSELTVKLTSVIIELSKVAACMEASSRKALRLLNNVVVGTGQCYV